MTQQKHTGEKGEQLALDYLKSKGYRLVRRNWRYSRAEVDIVVWDRKELVFIEVKTRRSNDFGDPEDFITTKQLERIAQAAPVLMEELNFEGEVRFDVISILLQPNGSVEIKHYEDAWYPGLDE